MEKQLFSEAIAMQDDLSSWRQTLHQMPELGIKLPQTIRFVAEELSKMGISCEINEEISCITAMLGEGGKCFMLRSDMDGLPIHEETGLAFASDNGCMHACGHDMHAAILLGAAKLLKQHEKELQGRVKLFFQSGEETFNGAKEAIRCGVLENPHVDAAFAMHVSSTVPVGVIAYGKMPMSSVYGFKITLTGKGGHGSTPELCIDPINTGVHVYLALQELIARECHPSAEVVLTLGQFAAGDAANVIPQTAVLQGTLRTFDAKTREYMIKRINEIVADVASTYRTQAEIEVLSDVPGVVCDEELNAEIAEGIKKMNSEFIIRPSFHAMGSEDFAFFSEVLASSSYFALGAGVEDKSKRAPQHNPKVLFNETCLPIGAAAYAATAVNWLKQHS